MAFETVLNVLWVCLGVCALGVFGWSEITSPPARAEARSRRLLSVIFAILFLFPCVSESDDLLTLQNLQFTLETRGEVGNPLPQNPTDERPGLQLERFFTSLQSCQVAALYAVLLILLCVAVVVPANATASERYSAAARGRAPPPRSSPLF